MACMIPVDLSLAEAMVALYFIGRMEGHIECSDAVETESSDLWEHRWGDSTNGRWTHRVIPNMRAWLELKHRETNYYITQAISAPLWIRCFTDLF